MTREEKTRLKEEKELEEIRKIKRKKRIKNTVILIILLIIFIIFLLYYMRFFETKMINVDEYKITSKKLDESFNGFKIVHISDIHYNVTTEKSDLKKVVKNVNKLNPDVVVFTGDLLDKNIEYTKGDYKDLIKELESINVKMNKYYITGENDNKKTNEIFEESNFINIENNTDNIYMDNNKYIRINGYNYNEDNNDIYTITLIHKPDDIKNVNNSDLILAGHSHNLEINIPYLKMLYAKDGSKKYYDKKYLIGDKVLYVNPGIGSHNIKFRLFNPPTINFYRFEKSN